MEGGSDTTLQPAAARPTRALLKIPALTVLHHVDRSRVGEVARLSELAGGREASLSRSALQFVPVTGGQARPLLDPYLSDKRPLQIKRASDGGVALEAPGAGLTVQGHAVEGTVTITGAQLDAGVVLTLAGRVALLLHRLGPPVKAAEGLGMIGASERLAELRADVLRVADLDVPLLVRGETGSGKELVARAVHQHSPRRPRPFVAVNMAAIPASTAASELFGHQAGAFTGAARARDGYFLEAHEGTLFLDEIAEVPGEVQAMLLRALETREVQALGSNRAQKVDVRLVAATDAELEELIATGAFREPLFHRIAGYQLHVPPLRERRDDIGRLLHHFLAEEMTAIGEVQKLDRPLTTDAPWLTADVAARLAMHDWPGNVRQLRNVVRQLVISSRGLDQARVDATLSRLIDELPPRPVETHDASPPAAAPATPVQELGDDRLLEVLRKNGWKTSATAQELGISRTTLYALIDRSKRIRKARDVPRDEIVAALAGCGGDVTAAAAKLEVSKRGLQLRITEDGIGS